MSHHAQLFRSEASAGAASRMADPKHLVDHFFRHEYGRLLATLLRILGHSRIDDAEDIAQEAIARALQVWPIKGLPDNPTAWIVRVARNIALDRIRHRRMALEKEDDVIAHLRGLCEESDSASPMSATAVGDDLLNAMLFVCDPILPPKTQVALALKILCGFSVREIARAFLANESAIERALARAKQKLRCAKTRFRDASLDEANDRLDSVLSALYCLFNEGYYASTGPRLIREELCQEAIRLAAHLVSLPIGNKPRIHALLALMLLAAGRFPARIDKDGNALTLEEQDRAKWNWELIRKGFAHFAQSAAGDNLSEFHLQAAIAATHCQAPTHAQVDWARIVGYYDQLVQLMPSPIVDMNRALAVSELSGAEAGLDELERLSRDPALAKNPLLHAARGALYARLGQHRTAAQCYREAISMTRVQAESHFLKTRLQESAKRSDASSSSSGENPLTSPHH